MTETTRILAAYAQARAQGRACALATITRVEGSSYRRVGARMLIGDDGELVGCVSGGCLERDLARKAAWAIAKGGRTLVAYDTRDDGDGGAAASRTPGAGLGCNGAIEILLEPIPAAAPHPVLEALTRCHAARRPGGVVLFPGDPRRASILCAGAAPELPADLPPGLAAALGEAWQAVAGRRRALGLAGGDGTLAQRVYIESFLPPVRLAVIGAGHDAVAMAFLGAHLGYEVSIVDLRSTLPLPRRAFHGAHAYIQCEPEELPQRLPLDGDSVVIVMTHQAQDDLAVMPYVAGSRPAYLGLLGPKVRGRRLLEACGALGIAGAERAHFPTGLDIGAETPDEIALAVFAEIQAVLAGRPAGFLKDRSGPIHARSPA